jgi:hypothetical protein
MRPQGRPDPERFADLREPDDDGDPQREPDDDRVRDELHEAPQTEEAREDEDPARQESRQDQEGMVVMCHEGRDHRDERGGRAVHLVLRSPEERSHEPGDGAAEDSLLGSKPRGHREPHRQRDGDHCHDEPRGEVAQDPEAPAIAAEVFIAAVPGSQEELEAPPQTAFAGVVLAGRMLDDLHVGAPTGTGSPP